MRTIRVWVRDFLHNDLLVVYLIFHLIFSHNIHWNTQLLRNISVIFTNILFMLIDFFYMFTLCLYTQFRKQIIIYTLLLRYMPSSGHVVVIHVVYYYSDIWRHLTMLSLFTLSTITQIYAFLWPCCRNSRCLLLLRYMTSSDHVVVIHVVYYYSDICLPLAMLS